MSGDALLTFWVRAEWTTTQLLGKLPGSCMCGTMLPCIMAAAMDGDFIKCRGIAPLPNRSAQPPGPRSPADRHAAGTLTQTPCCQQPQRHSPP